MWLLFFFYFCHEIKNLDRNLIVKITKKRLSFILKRNPYQLFLFNHINGWEIFLRKENFHLNTCKNLQKNTFDSCISPGTTIDNKNHWSVNNATLSGRE